MHVLAGPGLDAALGFTSAQAYATSQHGASARGHTGVQLGRLTSHQQQLGGPGRRTAWQPAAGLCLEPCPHRRLHHPEHQAPVRLRCSASCNAEAPACVVSAAPVARSVPQPCCVVQVEPAKCTPRCPAAKQRIVGRGVQSHSTVQMCCFCCCLLLTIGVDAHNTAAACRHSFA